MTLWCPRRDGAASEVIGYVLVTGISVLAIGLVMLTSGPALDRVQAEQEYDSTLRYYHDLDQSFEEILSGSPAGSTPIWRAAIGGGSLSLDNGTGHIWAYAVDHDANMDTWYADFDDGDNQVEVEVDGTVSGGLEVNASKWEGGTETELSVTVDGSGPWTLTLQDSGGNAVPVAGNTVEIQLEEGGNSDGVFSRVWITDAGTVEWTHAGGDQLRIFYQNTAIVGVRDQGQVLHNEPRIRPPETMGDGNEHVFVRLASMEGALSIGGDTVASVLVKSDGTHARHSTTDAERVVLYPATTGSTVWERFLTNTNRGYDYTWDDSPGTLGGEPAAVKTAGSDELHATMVQTEVTLTLRGGA